MLRSGQTETLRGLVADLSTGNGTAASSADWALREFPDPDGGSTPSLRNAETLGFTVGSIGRAIERTSESARERADLVEDLAGGAAALAGMAADPRAAAAAAALSGAAVAVSDWIAGDTVADNDALIGDLTRRFTPVFAGPEGEPVRDSALKAYRDAITAAMNGREIFSEYDRITRRSSAAP